jgi:hypothetical protein
MEEFAVAFFGGIGTGGELEGPEPELWLEFAFFWLADEAILMFVVPVR